MKGWAGGRARNRKRWLEAQQVSSSTVQKVASASAHISAINVGDDGHLSMYIVSCSCRRQEFMGRSHIWKSKSTRGR
jgi:hypothetical protein